MRAVPVAPALCLALAMTGCAHFRARTEPVSPTLEIPAPPPRVMTATLPATTTASATTETIPANPQPVPPEEPAEVDARRPSRAPAAAAQPRQDKPDSTAAAAPPRAPAANPPATLQTTTNVGEVEKRVRDTIAQASRDLGRINTRALNAEAKAQYDIAKRFVEQAGDAVNAKNFVFAGQLADKAANLATLLLTQ